MKVRSPLQTRKACEALTLVEVLVAVAILGVAVTTLMVATSTGLKAVKNAREDLRATQIMAQRLEVVRLMTWSQLNDANYLSTANFLEYYDTTATNSGSTNYGVIYRGNYDLLSCPFSASYAGALKQVRLTLVWTNGTVWSNGVKAPYVHYRTNYTLVCSNGLQNYIY